MSLYQHKQIYYKLGKWKFVVPNCNFLEVTAKEGGTEITIIYQVKQPTEDLYFGDVVLGTSYTIEIKGGEEFTIQWN